MIGNRIFVLAAASVALCAGLWAQATNGSISGLVQDPQGAVVAGAKVTLTNEGTNIGRSVVTNERGEYVFAAVEPGTDTLKITLQGYKTIEQAGIRIGTQQFLTLDETMEVGRIEENVTVTGSAPLIETSNASTGTPFNNTSTFARFDWRCPAGS